MSLHCSTPVSFMDKSIDFVFFWLFDSVRVETGDHFILPSRVSLWDLSPTKPIVPATNSACNGLTYIGWLFHERSVLSDIADNSFM